MVTILCIMGRNMHYTGSSYIIIIASAYVFLLLFLLCLFFFFQAEDGIRDADVTGVQTCALPIFGRTYPGGTPALVEAMNEKAAELEMTDSHFVDATGLSKRNVSSARDLAKLVRAAHSYPLIREYSTRDRATVTAFGRPLSFRNTNGLVRSSHWEIGLSKTGYISEAGPRLLIPVRLASKDLIVVLLDSWGKHSRVGDANRIKKWLDSHAASS